jgi:hypothetical protein
MAGVKSQGARLYYANTGTSWVALAAGSYPTTGYTEVARGISIDMKPTEKEQFDNSCLNDTAPVPELELKPGSLTFSREKDSSSNTLLALALAGTEKLWAFVYVDGTAITAEGKITCTGIKADKGFANRVNESYEIMLTEIPTTRAAA